MELGILRKIGLSEGEIKVYDALLNNAKSPINLIHEKTGIERRNIYDIINKLIERGLVSYITQNKRKVYSVSHPNKIISYIEDKEDELGRTKKDVQKEIPELIKKFEFKKPSINSEIFRGTEGIKAVWEDMLNYNEGYWIGSGRWLRIKCPNYWNNYHLRRAQKKIKWYNLLIHEYKGKENPLPFETIKFLPKEFSGNPNVIGIYGNKVVNFLLGEDMFAFVIESKELAESYKKYHKYLWGKAATK